MKDSEMFHWISQYKVIEEAIKGDKVSNVIYIERKYEIPRFHDKSRALRRFYAYDKEEFNVDNIKVKFYVCGWGDPYCKSIIIKLIVVPNNGKVIYSEVPTG